MGPVSGRAAPRVVAGLVDDNGRAGIRQPDRFGDRFRGLRKLQLKGFAALPYFSGDGLGRPVRQRGIAIRHRHDGRPRLGDVRV